MGGPPPFAPPPGPGGPPMGAGPGPFFGAPPPGPFGAPPAFPGYGGPPPHGYAGYVNPVALSTVVEHSHRSKASLGDNPRGGNGRYTIAAPSSIAVNICRW